MLCTPLCSVFQLFISVSSVRINHFSFHTTLTVRPASLTKICVWISVVQYKSTLDNVFLSVRLCVAFLSFRERARKKRKKSQINSMAFVGQMAFNKPHFITLSTKEKTNKISKKKERKIATCLYNSGRYGDVHFLLLALLRGDTNRLRVFITLKTVMSRSTVVTACGLRHRQSTSCWPLFCI